MAERKVQARRATDPFSIRLLARHRNADAGCAGAAGVGAVRQATNVARMHRIESQRSGLAERAIIIADPEGSPLPNSGIISETFMGNLAAFHARRWQ
jgi:hypothetical protein